MTSRVLSVVLLTLLTQINALEYVVFVHGLAGWGPDELGGVSYWGFKGVTIDYPGFINWMLGFNDWAGEDYLLKFPTSQYKVFYASVGPISSNHDRACELYAQIKGSVVDYGYQHSNFYRHKRYGKNYTGKGFYPEWSASNRIHFVGHSMGGNTIRYLEYLLYNGNATEVANPGPGGLNPLFQTNRAGGGNWIKSITTISTPHDGSPLHTKLDTGSSFTWKDQNGNNVQIFNLAGYLQNLVTLVGAGINVVGLNWLYDFDLDHWGVSKLPTETVLQYANRVATNVTLFATSDLASWDLSPQWSRSFNTKHGQAKDGTYYFSISTYKTSPQSACDWSCGVNCIWPGWNEYDQVPDSSMEVIMALPGAIIGNLDGMQDSSGNYWFANPTTCDWDNEWEKNDGLVPVRSSKTPRDGLPVNTYVAPGTWPVGSAISTYSFVKGKWHNRLVNRDHTQIIGFNLNAWQSNPSAGIYDDIKLTLDRITALG